jgi:hypothetical protein
MSIWIWVTVLYIIVVGIFVFCHIQDLNEFYDSEQELRTMGSVLLTDGLKQAKLTLLSPILCEACNGFTISPMVAPGVTTPSRERSKVLK